MATLPSQVLRSHYRNNERAKKHFVKIYRKNSQFFADFAQSVSEKHPLNAMFSADAKIFAPRVTAHLRITRRADQHANHMHGSKNGDDALLHDHPSLHAR